MSLPDAPELRASAAARAADGEAAGGPLGTLTHALLARDGRYARAFENLILALVLFSVASVGIETIRGLPAPMVRALRWSEILVVAVFTFEYLLRILATPRRLAFIFSFQGLVDLAAIAPFYIAGLDARWLRTLRLLRLLRVLKLQTHILETTVAERTRQLADKNAALEQAQAQIRAELEVARSLQIAILPASFPGSAGCDGAARMIPATTMGGDFYDFIPLPGGEIGLVIADVSGKGVPAAFFMAVARTNLRDLAVRHHSPGECLSHTNDVLCEQNPLELFVTVFYGILDPASGQLRYANGGHNPPLLRRADGAIETLSGKGGLVLGAMPGIEYPDHLLQLKPGDRLVLYTDGVTEAFDATEQAYGAERLAEDLAARGSGTAEELLEHICARVAGFAGPAAQSDDITLIVLSVDHPAAA
jgi:phosphoserine phosphatase RsbU/P